MLTETDVHFLVGILVRSSSPTDVDILLGDMVNDVAANRKRDVDITVTMKDETGALTAYSGIEVKKESRPLDATTVEQLIRKIQDMPEITNRAIVSASGFSKTVVRKARYHNTDLYDLVDWTEPLVGFEHLNPMISFDINHSHYQWSDGTRLQFSCDPPLSDAEVQLMHANCDVCDTEGVPVAAHPKMHDFAKRLLENCFLWLNDDDVAPIPTDIEHFLKVRLDFDDEVFLRLNQSLRRVFSVDILGSVTKTRSIIVTTFKVLLKHGNTVPFCGCAVGMLPDGQLRVFSFSKAHRDIGLSTISVGERLQKKIYKQPMTRRRVQESH
jgi:hypothetical protein